MTPTAWLAAAVLCEAVALVYLGLRVRRIEHARRVRRIEREGRP